MKVIDEGSKGVRYVNLFNVRNREILLGNDQSLRAFERTASGLPSELNARATSCYHEFGDISSVFGELYLGSMPTLYLPNGESVVQEASIPDMINCYLDASFHIQREHTGGTFGREDYTVQLMSELVNGVCGFDRFLESCMDTVELSKIHNRNDYGAFFERVRAYPWNDDNDPCGYRRIGFENQLKALDNGIAYLSFRISAHLKDEPPQDHT